MARYGKGCNSATRTVTRQVARDVLPSAVRRPLPAVHCLLLATRCSLLCILVAAYTSRSSLFAESAGRCPLPAVSWPLVADHRSLLLSPHFAPTTPLRRGRDLIRPTMQGDDADHGCGPPPLPDTYVIACLIPLKAKDRAGVTHREV